MAPNNCNTTNGPGQNHQPSAASDFLRALTAPQRMILMGCSFGENNFRLGRDNFRSRAAQAVSHWYCFVVTGLMVYMLVAHISAAIFQMLGSVGFQLYKNMLDAYSISGAQIIYAVRLIVTLVFLIGLMKLGKFSALSKMLDGDNYKVINEMLVLQKELLKEKVKRKYIAWTYVILLCYLLTALSNFLHLTTSGMGDLCINFFVALTYFVGDTVLGVCLSLSVSIYIFTAAIWHMFNEEIKKETNASVSSSSLTDRELMDAYKDCYDCLSEFTGFVAENCRYYNIVFIAGITDFIYVVYATGGYLDLDGIDLFICWLGIAVQFSALFAAAFVYKHASRTAELLYRFQQKKANSRQSGAREEWPGFRDFYHRVAHEWAPTKVDVLGVIPITFTMVGVLVFTGLNWIAIILQFRQAEPSFAPSNSSINNGCICEVRNGSFGSISNYSLNQSQF